MLLVEENRELPRRKCVDWNSPALRTWPARPDALRSASQAYLVHKVETVPFSPRERRVLDFPGYRAAIHAPRGEFTIQIPDYLSAGRVARGDEYIERVGLR